MVRPLIGLSHLYALEKFWAKVCKYVEVKLLPKGMKLKNIATNKTDKMLVIWLKNIGVYDYSAVEKIQNSCSHSMIYIKCDVQDTYHNFGNILNYGIDQPANLTYYRYLKLSSSNFLKLLFYPPFQSSIINISNLSCSKD